MKAAMKLFFKFLVTSLLLVSCHTENNRKMSLDDQPRKIELLFLGHDQENHDSRAYMPVLASALAKDGINITYSEDVDDINAENLGLYDGLIVYANHENLDADQEKALLNFVAEGKGFIPIHSASFCFKDSEAYIDLVGGQFSTHKTGRFTASIVDSTHAIMKNIEEFETWDETYVHDKIANDIKVLMERVEAGHREPYTWVKNYGEGKVFYTALGHDERTWENPKFHKLLREGILWAVNDKVKQNWKAFVKEMPELKYEERENIPNYEKRDPPLKYQLPLSAAESAKLIQVPPGFELQLFASEPDIINPIAANWDEKGRLWVIETVDYPNTVRNDKGQGDDRIKILEDTDGDGRADKVTVFADKLNIPTSFAFYNGGIIVSQAPQFLFLKDVDGDDKADIKETLIDGWGVFDTHAGPSNLQRGIDNNIYGVVGYSGFKGEIFGEEYQFSQGMYRFDPKKETFEFLTRTSNNTWGLGITEDNSLFASTANNTHSVYLGIPDKNLKGVEGIPLNGSLKIDGHYDIRPITKNIRQVDVFGGFTAAAGHHFYTARDYPSSYFNKVAFVCEPTGGIVHMAKIHQEGAGYVETDGGNLLASSDEWVSPVEAKVGPDGAVWVLDWYNFIIQHNPTPNIERGGYDAVNGKGNAYENPLRDKSRGRIYRVVSKMNGPGQKMDLDSTDPKALVKALSHSNMFWRMTAQRLLVERGKRDVVKPLAKLVAKNKVDELNMNPAALHALWTLEGLGALEATPELYELVEKALQHPAPSVRKAALQILPKNKGSDEAILKGGMLNDKDPKVRLAALLYFSERPESVKIGNLLYQLSKEAEIVEDTWLSKALYAAASAHAKGFMQKMKLVKPNLHETKREVKRFVIDYDDSHWKTMELPQLIEDAGLDMDGIIWFRKEVVISSDVSIGTATISLGPIDDSDVVYINGERVGGIEQSYDIERVYKIPKGILRKGRNSIAVRVEDTGGGGGIYGKEGQMFLQFGKQKIPLSGKWGYEVEKNLLGNTDEIFATSSIAEVFAKAYIDKIDMVKNKTDIDEGRLVVTMQTVKNEMKYDLSEFVVTAGESVELILENVDFMQHNLVIVKPGAMEKVGLASDKLAADPKGAEQNYVPKMDEVLFATTLVDPEQTVSLKFTAPSEPGEYPFICTFPGHWRIMKGVMKVVPN
ncbi:PVC-type heme-binding CxxCH protein [Zobellia uliginosa]|uniref:PVC-type heme-binding CxxCH protein n=1 Tax=Zobellia uliginosa TaxID=143224 RepID=UPI0026E3A122|nr:PVC-type heme-binding CxxCH protein [Zobellia uliginosa]MDO6518750.1 ThuA domain-containing protein [Zobellia uliginosa]